MDSTRKNRFGFTLIEMLVVVFIIATLIGLLLPAVNAARESARATQCINNQQELGKALIQYDLAKGRLPGVLSFVNPAETDPTKLASINWVMTIFAELGRMDLWQQCQTDALSLPAPVNNYISYTSVKVTQLICPSNSLVDPVGGLSYVVNLGVYNTVDPTDYSRRLFRNLAIWGSSSTPPKANPEPNQTLTSVKSLTRTVMLSEKLTEKLPIRGWNIVPDPASAFTPNLYPDTSLLIPRYIDYLVFDWPYIASTTPPQPSTEKIKDLPPGLGSLHRGNIIVTFCDGHSEKIPDTTSCLNDPDNSLFGTP